VKQEGEEGELGSDLDDSDDEEPQTDNLVLCQFEKVGLAYSNRGLISSFHTTGNPNQEQEEMQSKGWGYASERSRLPI